MDFKSLSASLLTQIKELLPQWLPGGHIAGREYECGDLGGDSGKSLKINLDTGLWSDFATDNRGGDLISLYAAIHGLTQGEAAKILSQDITPIYPPDGVSFPQITATAIYQYRSANGQLLFLISRHEKTQKDGEVKKSFTHWTWSESGWQTKGHPAPRTLYRQERLEIRPDAPVLVVEGEKSAHAAEILCPDYCVISWSGGVNSWRQSTWAALRGRQVLLWPDADQAGVRAMQGLAQHLLKICQSVKILQLTDADLAGDTGIDAFDRLYSDKWNYSTLREWASTRETVVVAAPKPERAISTELTALYDQLGIAYNKKTAIPVNDQANAFLIIQHLYKNKFYFDSFANQSMKRLSDGSSIGQTDQDGLHITMVLQNEYEFRKIGKNIIEDALYVFARQNQINPLQDWLKALKWDQKPRIERLFSDYFGADHTPYTESVSRNFMISLVARAMKPGCKVDTMVVLEGLQGDEKNKAFDALVKKEWNGEGKFDVDSKDFYIKLQGKWLIQISEMSNFSKADMESVKQMLSCATDRYREMYGRHATDHDRSCVFIGTTNKYQYLTDETGNRRFWPIKCISKIRPDLILSDRNLLFSEAIFYYLRGDSWWEFPPSVLKSVADEQDARMVYDEWTKIVETYLLGKTDISVLEIATSKDGLDIPKDKLDMRSQQRIGKILTILNWKQYQGRTGDKRERRYRKFHKHEQTPDQMPF